VSARRPQKPVDSLPLFRAPPRPMATRLSGVVESWLDYARNMTGEPKREFLSDCLRRVHLSQSQIEAGSLSPAYRALDRQDFAVAERRVAWALGAAQDPAR